MNVSLRTIGANALSILTSDVLSRATSFVLYAMVARHLGAIEFGRLSLALSLFYVFQVSAVAGLKTLIVREVAKDRSQTRLYFNNGCTIVAVSSLVSLTALYFFLHIMHYSAETSSIVLLLSLALFPYAIASVCEGIFQAWETMRYIASVNVPVNIVKLVLAYVLLANNRGLNAVIWILLASFFTIAAMEVLLVLRRFPAQRAPVSLAFCFATIRPAVTFLAIDKFVALESSINIILLSKLATEKEVGLYSAAAQLMVPLVLVYQSIAQSIFPVMCRSVAPGLQVLKRIAERSMEMLLFLAVPMVTGILFMGSWALTLLYKNPAFQQAVPALRIMAWVLILQVFTFILGQVLLASHHEKITLRIIVVVLLVDLVAGWPLIHYFGLLGAATTLLLARMISCVQHYIPVARLLSGFHLGKIFWKPILAAGVMAVFLAALPANLPGALKVASATLVYAAALFALGVLSSGSLRELKNKYFLFGSE